MSFLKSIQLYTLKEETAKDFLGTLEKVATIGYDAVEFAGYGGLSLNKMKDQLDRLGLKVTGNHIQHKRLVENFEEELEFNKAVGNKYMVVPHYKFEKAEDFYELVKSLNKIGEKCKKEGMQLCFHNHRTEFQYFDGRLGMDILLEDTDPGLLMAEVDTYWVKFAGIDPLEYIKKLQGRCPLLHLKDMENNEEHKSTEVGNGIMDFKAMVPVAEKLGTEAMIVEQEFFRLPYFESAEISFKNLKKLLED